MSWGADTAPPDRFVGLLVVLMGCAYGWIVALRREGAFFPVEQLLVHGEWILALADTVTEPPAQDAGQRQQIYVYRCAKMYLRCEIANCYASRGQYERSLALMEQALGEIEGTDLTIHAHGMVAKVACDAIVDAMTSDQTAEKAAVFAQRGVTEVSRFEHLVNPGDRPLIATIAYQAAHAMRMLTTPKALTLIDQLNLIAARNHTSTLPVEQVNQIHHNIKRGNFTPALALIYDNIMYDNFEAIANLRLSRLTPATRLDPRRSWRIDFILGVGAGRARGACRDCPRGTKRESTRAITRRCWWTSPQTGHEELRSAQHRRRSRCAESRGLFDDG